MSGTRKTGAKRLERGRVALGTLVPSPGSRLPRGRLDSGWLVRPVNRFGSYTPRGEKCDVPGREGEPPCEPGKGGRASTRAWEGRASLRASREGRASLRASRGREGEPPCEPGKGGRASVRAGEGRASLRASRRGSEGEPPCEPAGIGGRASVRAGGDRRASLRASRRGSEKARTEPRPPKMAQSRPREVSTPRGEKCDGPGREGEPPCEPAGIGEGSDGASPSQNGSIPTTRGITPAENTATPPGWRPVGPPARGRETQRWEHTRLRDCPRSPGGATAHSQGRQPLDRDPDPNHSPRRPPNPGRRPGLGGRLGESDGCTVTRG